MYGDLKQIRALAAKGNWREIDHQENINMVSFSRGDQRVNIYYSKMTVATCLNHPKKGKTQLFRRHVDTETLERIFQNPRVHTQIGYFTR